MVKVHKMIDAKSEFEKLLLIAHEEECKELSKELEREGRRLLNLTLEKRRPETGFQKAKVSIDKKVMRKRNGCVIEMHFLVTDGSGRTPHRIWHIINRGRKPFVAKNTTRFRNIKQPRTHRRRLEVDQFGGYGDWVTIRKGRRYGKIKAREFYKETVSRLKKNKLKKTRYKFIEVNEFEVNNG